MRKRLGTCPREVIDWTQDRLRTTRPIAERVVFRLMERGAVVLDGDHYILREDERIVEREAVQVGMDLNKNRTPIHRHGHPTVLKAHKGQQGWDIGSGTGSRVRADRDNEDE